MAQQIELVGGYMHGRKLTIPDGQHEIRIPDDRIRPLRWDGSKQIEPIRTFVYRSRIANGKVVTFDPGVWIFEFVGQH
jgi:hypothetical protein